MILKKINAALLCFMLCAIFAGCGKADETTVEKPGKADEAPALWKTRGFAISQDDADKQELNVKEYQLLEHDEVFDAEAGELRYLIDSGSCGELVWMLHQVYDRNGSHKEWVLEIYDASADEYTVKRFTHEQLGLEGGRLDGMNMIDKDHYVFRQMECEIDDGGLYRWTADKWIYTDLAGDIHTVDFLPACLAKGLVDDEFAYSGWFPLREVNCDGRGNICMLGGLQQIGSGWGYTSLHIFDRDGNMILEYKGDETGQTVQEPLRTWDGELIFPIKNSQTRQTEYFWADTEGGGLRLLAGEKTPTNGIYNLYGMWGNDIYYNEGNREIIKWNIESGNRTSILSLPGNGIAVNIRILMALGKEEDYPVLCLIDQSNGRDWLAPLTDQETDRETIRITDIAKDNRSFGENVVSDAVALCCSYNRSVDYKYRRETSDEFRTKLFADLSSGKGPDVMYVSMEDMRMLAEKGALLELGELLPEGLTEEILPAALELGTVDGKLMGLPTGLLADLVMVSRDVWSEDSWRLEDVISLMESGELEGGVFYSEDFFWPMGSVRALIRYNLHDSFLIDWENRKCHFDDERFIRLLELTRTHLTGDPAYADTRLGSGNRVALSSVSAYDANDFDLDRELENGNYVGYPTESGCGNYLTGGGVVVVNAATENREAVREFLAVVFGSKIQGNQTERLGICGVNPERGYTDYETGKKMWFNNQEIVTFSDGTTSIDRLNLFLKTCVAAPPDYPFLENILREELEIMYAENRDPRDAAKVINNRIQLYLDEG